MERFDTDSPADWSAAARDLASRKPGLEEGIRLARSEAAARAGRMTKTELLTALSGTVTAKDKRGTVTALVTRYADQAARDSDEHAELARLNREAGLDRMVAGQLNSAADNYDALTAKFRDSGNMAYTVEWHGDDMITAKYLAQYAQHVHAAITNGGLDLREAVLAVAHDAMREVLSFPRGSSNLRLDGHGMDEAGQARAAADFIRLALPALGDTIPASLISA